jgi:YD repeat-containing protein
MRTPKEGTEHQDLPVRNASIVGYHVYSHSGEFAPRVTDVALKGRGLSIFIMRQYRGARATEAGEFGRGWFFNYSRAFHVNEQGLSYRDGCGRTHLFEAISGSPGEFRSPRDFYAVLRRVGRTLEMRQRLGIRYVFEPVEDGGRMLFIEYRNRNRITFNYTKDTVKVVSPFGQELRIEYRQGLVTSVTDHIGRSWTYFYDGANRLIKVTQPASQPKDPPATWEYRYDSANLELLGRARGVIQSLADSIRDDSLRRKFLAARPFCER